jgi:hypothetical protein
MRETNIYARPAATLYEWRALETDRAVSLLGCDRHGEILPTVIVLYLDAEKQLCVDPSGVIWHIPVSHAMLDNTTQEFRALLVTPRNLRPCDFIFADDCPELRNLLSKK